jgi:hypothetical protein
MPKAGKIHLFKSYHCTFKHYGAVTETYAKTYISRLMAVKRRFLRR